MEKAKIHHWARYETFARGDHHEVNATKTEMLLYMEYCLTKQVACIVEILKIPSIGQYLVHVGRVLPDVVHAHPLGKAVKDRIPGRGGNQATPSNIQLVVQCKALGIATQNLLTLGATRRQEVVSTPTVTIVR
jgi:hypothetical protein